MRCRCASGLPFFATKFIFVASVCIVVSSLVVWYFFCWHHPCRAVSALPTPVKSFADGIVKRHQKLPAPKNSVTEIIEEKMAVEMLFDKCPVLPVDASISVAKYLRSIRQTLRQAHESEEANDLERAALLQIRVLQLICKTLPSHPEYQLAENTAVVKELRGIAHTSFFNIERLSIRLDEMHAPAVKSSAATAIRRAKPHRVEMSAALMELFERIAAENTAKGLNTIGLLAGRLAHEAPTKHAREVENGAAMGQEESLIRITALVIPAQISLADRSDIRYETDVSQLLDVKDLVQLGFIQMCPNQDRLRLSPAASRLLAGLQQVQPEALGVVIAPKDPRGFCAYSLTDFGGLPYVLACAARDSLPAGEIIPRGEAGEGRAIWSVAKHLDMRPDGEPMFKLYDLRPLAVARDEQERKMKRGTSK